MSSITDLVDFIFPDVKAKLRQRDRILTLFQLAILADPEAVAYLEVKLGIPQGGTFDDVFENYPFFHYTESWKNYHKDVVQLLVDDGQLDIVTKIYQHNYPIDTSLIGAGLNGHLAMIDHILERCSDSYKTQYLCHAILGAVQSGRQEELVRDLISPCPDTDVRRPYITANPFVYGLVGAFNSGNEEDINFFTFFISPVDLRMSFMPDDLVLLKLESTTLAALKRFYSPQFEAFRNFFSKKTQYGFTSIEERILTYGDRAKIEWLYYNILAEHIPIALLGKGSLPLNQFYESLHGDTEIRVEIVNFVYNAIRQHRPMKTIHYALDKGFKHWSMAIITASNSQDYRLIEFFRKCRREKR